MARLLSKPKVEAKVWAATTAAFVVSVAVGLLNQIQDNDALLGSLQFVILAVAPTAATFLAGYAAKHTPRSPDPP